MCQNNGLEKRTVEVKSLSYTDCANALLFMWLEEVLTDGEYYRIIDKLSEHAARIDHDNAS